MALKCKDLVVTKEALGVLEARLLGTKTTEASLPAGKARVKRRKLRSKMKSNYEIIKTPLITEKLQSQQSQGIYGFWVDKKANKIEIRKAIEKIYSVSVERVSVLTVPGKKRRLRFKEGHQPSWKKAVVRIKAGQTINIA